jgi:predicted transcriptional regulator
MITLDWIVAELHRRRGEWHQISEASGVPYFTIAKISQGVTKNPRWKTIVSLGETLGYTDQAA